MEAMEVDSECTAESVGQTSRSQNLSDILNEVFAKCRNAVIPPLSFHQEAELPYHREVIDEVRGTLLLLDFPHYGFALKDDSTTLSIIIKNPLDNVVSYLLAANHLVLIKNACFILEFYPDVCSESSQNVCVKYLEVHENAIIIGAPHKPIKELTTEEIRKNYFSQEVFVLNVSSAFKSVHALPYCLVLVRLIFSNRQSETKWIVLREKQVSWSVVLFTGCKYELLIPQNCQSALDKKRPLFLCTPPDIEEGFKPFFHHPELFPSMDCCYLPMDSKLRLSPSKLTRQIDESQRVSEAKEDCSMLFSLVGEIKRIGYCIKSKSSACYMCDKKERNLTEHDEQRKKLKPFNPRKGEINRNPSVSNIIFPESVSISSTEHQKTFGLLGNLSKYIHLKDSCGNTTGVYLRDPCFNGTSKSPSFFFGSLFPGGILPNSYVCFDNLKKKVAKVSGNIYFVSTPITRITILHQKSSQPGWNIWQAYGYPLQAQSWIPGCVFWFQLDLDDLLKVKIAALCTVCGSQFYRGNCSREVCPSYESKIEALAFVRVRRHNLPSAVVVLKDENVQTLLGAKELEWKLFSNAAEESEILYIRTMSVPACNDFGILFHYYCRYFMSRRFHISARILKTAENEDPRLFCINISPINTERTLMAYEELT